MIWGRPPNLILGALTAVWNVAVLVLNTQGVQIPDGITAAVNLAAGAVIAVIAYQPPTLAPGDKFTVQTATGQPNFETTVATPPAADPPPAVKP